MIVWFEKKNHNNYLISNTTDTNDKPNHRYFLHQTHISATIYPYTT